MEATREVQRIEEFSKGATGWASWALDYVVKGSLVWGMSLLGFGKAAGEAAGRLSGTYVLVDRVKVWGNSFPSFSQCRSLASLIFIWQRAAERVYQRHFEGGEGFESDNIMEAGEVWRRYAAAVAFAGGRQLTELDMDLVLIRLVADRRVVVGKSQDGARVVKFLVAQKEGPGATTSSPLPKLTVVDLGMYSLKTSIASLTRQIADLEARAEACKQLAREALAKGGRDKALYQLKKRRFVEGILKKNQGALSNVEEILLRLESAKTERQVAEAYESGKEALESLLAKGRTAESLDELLDDIRDLVTQTEDVSAALSTGLVDMDEEELERELEDVVARDQQHQAAPATPAKRAAGERQRERRSSESEREVPEAGEEEEEREVPVVDAEGETPKKKKAETATREAVLA